MNREGGGYGHGSGFGRGGYYNRGGLQPRGGSFSGAGAGRGRSGGGGGFYNRFNQEQTLEPRLRREHRGGHSVPPPTWGMRRSNDNSSGPATAGSERVPGFGRGGPPRPEYNAAPGYPPLENIEDDGGCYVLPRQMKPTTQSLQNVRKQEFNHQGVPSPRPTSESSFSTTLSDSDGKPKRNQCEIVYETGNDRVEAYAYRIETSIQRLGLTTGIMFPRAGINVVDILRGLSTCGTKFVVLINDSNVGNETFTLNILQPEELRAELKNISHDDGLKKIVEVMRRVAQRNEITTMPTNIRSLFKSMVQGKFLSDSEYQSCMKYTSSRWENQRKYQGNVDFKVGTGVYTEVQPQEKEIEILDEVHTDLGGTNKEVKNDVVRRKISAESHELANSRKMAKRSASDCTLKTTDTPPPPDIGCIRTSEGEEDEPVVLGVDFNERGFDETDRIDVKPIILP